MNNYFLYFPKKPSWSWLYSSWIYNYQCNQCLSPLTLWVRIPFMRGVFDTTLFDKVYEWLAAIRWFSPGTPLHALNVFPILRCAAIHIESYILIQVIHFYMPSYSCCMKNLDFLLIFAWFFFCIFRYMWT